MLKICGIVKFNNSPHIIKFHDYLKCAIKLCVFNPFGKYTRIPCPTLQHHICILDNCREREGIKLNIIFIS